MEKGMGKRRLRLAFALAILPIGIFSFLAGNVLLSPEGFVIELSHPADGAVFTERQITFGAKVVQGSGGEPETFTLGVSKQGDGSGTVISDPSGIDCGSSCSAEFSEGESVSLSASASSGSAFTGWSGDCSGTGSCVIKMDSNKDVVATFDSGPIIGPSGGGSNGTEPDPTGHTDPTYYEFSGLNLSAEGWTIFPASEDTKIVFVSSSDGDDGTCGFYNASDLGIETSEDLDGFNPLAQGVVPCATAPVAYGKLRDGYPDWMVLKRGDAFNSSLTTSFNGDWTKDGRSKTERMMVGAYGTGDRPIMRHNGRVWSDFYDNVMYFALTSIRTYPYEKDPFSPDFETQGRGGEVYIQNHLTDGGTHHVLIEDVHVQYAELLIQEPGEILESLNYLALRRNLVTDSYGYSGHDQGSYIRSISNFWLEGNFYDHNGGNRELSTGEYILPEKYSQMTISLEEFQNISDGQIGIRWTADIGGEREHFFDGIDFTGVESFQDVADVLLAAFQTVQPNMSNITYVNYTSPGGKHFNLLTVWSVTSGPSPGEIKDYEGSASGTELHDKIMYGGAISFGRPPRATIYNHNVYSRLIRNGTYKENILARGSSFGMSMTGDSGPNSVTNPLIENNLFFGNANTFVHGVDNSNYSIVNTRILNNVATEIGRDDEDPYWTGDPQSLGFGMGNADGAFFIGNLMIHKLPMGTTTRVQFPSGHHFRDVLVTGNVVYNWSGGSIPSAGSIWGENITVTGNKEDLSASNFSDPTRSLGSYDASLGGPGTVENLISEIREQRKGNWREEYTACAINNYLRAGFDMDQIDC